MAVPPVELENPTCSFNFQSHQLVTMAGRDHSWCFHTASENRQFFLASLWRGLERESLTLIPWLLDKYTLSLMLIVFYAGLVTRTRQGSGRNRLFSFVKNHDWYEIILSMRERQWDGFSYCSTHSCRLRCKNYKVNIIEHLAAHKPKTVIQIKDQHNWHKEVLLQHSPLSMLGSTLVSSLIRLPPGCLWIPGWWRPGLVQGQEVPDVQDALLLLLNTAISWGRGGSTAPPLHQPVLNYKLGFVSPLWASAAPALSRGSSQTEPAINQPASGKDTHVSLNKVYLPPLCLSFAERIFFKTI